MNGSDRLRRWQPLVLSAAVILLAAFFAKVEIQIEGGNGWAAQLPVEWRIDHHWLLDWFWGGRPMTAYHAWIFSFMLLAFHFPFAVLWQWRLRLEARALGCLFLFWIIEDWLWFIFNPAFGSAGLDPRTAWWHKHWLLGLPTDYWVFSVAGGCLLWWSFREPKAGTVRSTGDAPRVSRSDPADPPG